MDPSPNTTEWAISDCADLPITVEAPPYAFALKPIATANVVLSPVEEIALPVPLRSALPT